jgi:hypothetical protein
VFEIIFFFVKNNGVKNCEKKNSLKQAFNRRRSPGTYIYSSHYIGLKCCPRAGS